VKVNRRGKGPLHHLVKGPLHHWCKGPSLMQLLFYRKMPTFKKSKSLKGLFSDQDIACAVEDVLKNGLKVREAARKFNLCHSTLSRYLKRIRNGEIDREKVKKLSMASVQVSLMWLLSLNNLTIF